MKAVIFDLDRTLVDSALDIHAAATALLQAKGCAPLSFDLVKSFVGNGIPKLVERVMRASDLDISEPHCAEMTDEFVDLYAAAPAALSTLYPNVRKILTMLTEQGIALGVCTNKNHALSVQILRDLDLAPFFNSVIGGDSLPQRKPDPAPLQQCAKDLTARELVYVGDSEVDAETAVATGVPFALFTQGYRKSPVSRIPHDFAFDDFAMLPGALLNLFKKSETS